MEVFLYNSTVCRLCGEENDSGSFLYSSEENNPSISDLINTYLPIKVSDDGQLPRTICPGCTIQLEAAVEFLNLIINGQKVIRELHQRESEYKKTVLNESEVITEKIVYEINTSNGVYQVEHPIALQVSGLDKPKRKRGRPPKKPKTEEQLQQEMAAKEVAPEPPKPVVEAEVTGKRRRKTPTRFKEAVQGKELERIFKEEGVIDGDESEAEVKPDITAESRPAREPEVIGHMEVSGELVVVVKGKGRGRPRGRMRPTREVCAICGMEFSCVGRYMSHVAQHGPVTYECSGCDHVATTRIDHQTHQESTGHTGQKIIQRPANDATTSANPEITLEKQEQPTELEKVVIVSDMAVLLPNPPLEAASGTSFIEIEVPKAEHVDTEAIPNADSSNKDTENKESNEVAVTTGPKGKVKLKCNQCDKMFSSKQSKSLHIKAVHAGEKAYSCVECGLRFAYPRSLALHKLSHRRRHQQGKRYACDLCGKVLNHPSSVVYHKEAEHAGQRYVCSKCGKSFKHRQLLQRHQLVHSQHRPYTCKLCNATFKTKANLINHQLLHSGVKKFSCEICKHKFAHKTSLTLHMRWHTGTKPYACTTCGKSFSQKGNLSEHQRIHTGEKPYQCDLCPRRFTTSSQYRLHARRHQPDRPYACTHCPKRFVSRGSWAAHQRRLVRPRAHTCAVCGRSFHERWPLHKHMRRHTGERPFRCPHCPRTFADASNLNKHKKQVHKQISLLVNSEPQPSPSEQSPQQEVLTMADVMSDVEGDDEKVIYVTYDVDDTEPGFHILDPEQVASIQGSAVLYGEPSPLVLPTPATLPTLPTLPALPAAPDVDEIAVSDEPGIVQVTDEQGNPLHFTMQDGTRLAITSTDGKSLQVITQDGQTIPVEINEFNDEEDVDEAPETVVHQISLQNEEEATASSPVTHYFTIV